MGTASIGITTNAKGAEEQEISCCDLGWIEYPLWVLVIRDYFLTVCLMRRLCLSRWPSAACLLYEVPRSQ